MKLVRTFSILLLLLLAADFTAPVCYGQVLPVMGVFALANGARRGTPMNYQKGSYQLSDGSWRQGKWLINYDKLSVIDPERKKEEPKEFSTAEVQRFVASTDTFLVVQNIDIPTPLAHVDAGFARQIYRGGEFLLVHYVYFRPNTAVAKSYTMLVRGHEAPAIVPDKPREFRKFMLTYVGEHPQLSKQLAGNVLTPEHTVEILRNYVNWKKYQQTHTSPASE